METKKPVIKLKHHREKAELSLNRLSGLCGLSTDYLWKIEQGKVSNIGLDSIKSIAKALKVSVFDLINEAANV